MSTRLFNTFAPRGFFVTGRTAYAFNRFHAPLGHAKPVLPPEDHETLVYAYSAKGIDWDDSESRAVYFERLADIERSYDVEWCWAEPQKPARPSPSFLSRKPSSGFVPKRPS